MRPKLVYVEDNADARSLVELVLGEACDVLAAADGQAGLELVRAERPDLVLVDLDLPLLGGLELVRALRRDPQLRATPVVAITANVMQGERQRCLDAGCAAFVAKPYDIHELRALVRDLLPGDARGGVA
jgi:two-component system cell cycle response regulator DivK